jgi:hypothetical protein
VVLLVVLVVLVVLLVLLPLSCQPCEVKSFDLPLQPCSERRREKL